MATNKPNEIPDKVWRAILKEAARGVSYAELARKWGPKIEAEYGFRISAAGIARRAKSAGGAEHGASHQREPDIVDRILATMADLPDEVFARWPNDSADQLDHYVYGLPKRKH